MQQTNKQAKRVQLHNFSTNIPYKTAHCGKYGHINGSIAVLHNAS